MVTTVFYHSPWSESGGTLAPVGGRIWYNQHSLPVNVTLFGKRVFSDVFNFLWMRFSQTRVGPKPNDPCRYRRQKRRRYIETRGRRPCEKLSKDRGRGWSCAAMRQGWRKPQKAGERHGMDSPSEPPGGSNSASTLIVHFWPPAPGQNTFLLS